MINISPSRFVVQCDWDFSISNQTETFWAAFKKPGQNGVYFDLLPEALKAGKKQDLQYPEEIVATNPRYSATYCRKERSLRIYDQSTTDNYGTVFYTPSSIGEDIHGKNIYSLDVTPGGLGVSSDSSGNLIVWDANLFAPRRSLKGHVGDVYSCKYFPSGLVVLSGGADMQLKIWSVETGECAKTLVGHEQAITDVGFIDRGRNILSCSKDGTCRLWDCGMDGNLHKFTSPGGVQVNALSLVSTATKTSSGRGSGIENKLVAIACENGALAGFGLGDKAKVFEIRCDGAANTCAFYDEYTLICGTQKGFLFALDLRKTSTFLHVIQDDRGAVLNLCPMGKGYWASFGDGSVCCRTLDPSRNGSFSEMELSGPDCDPVYGVCTDGTDLYTCCRDTKIRKYKF